MTPKQKMIYSNIYLELMKGNDMEYDTLDPDKAAMEFCTTLALINVDFKLSGYRVTLYTGAFVQFV